MAIGSQLVTKFSDLNHREIVERTPLLENQEFTKDSFCLYCLNFHISLAISGTLMTFSEHIKKIKM